MMQMMRASSPLVGSNVMSRPVIQNDRRSSCRQPLISTPLSPLTVCQLDSSKSTASSSESSRRSLMIATMVSVMGATVSGVITRPDSAHAAKRKPPPPPEEKPGEDEKYLSAYDAKVLANIRRKEALKALVETQKAKARLVRQPEEPPLDVFGQAPPSESEASQLE